MIAERYMMPQGIARFNPEAEVRHQLVIGMEQYLYFPPQQRSHASEVIPKRYHT